MTEFAASLLDQVEGKNTLEFKKISIGLKIEQGLYEEAKPTIEELLSTNPGERELWLQLKLCQSKLGLQLEMEKTIIKLLGFRQELSELITDYGLLKISQGKLAEARILLFKAVQDNPLSIIAQLNLGKVCVQLKQYEDAKRALSSANILDPMSQEVWVYLSIVSIEHEDSRRHLQTALRECIKLPCENVSLLQTLMETLERYGLLRERQLVELEAKKPDKSVVKLRDPPSGHQQRPSMKNTER